MIRNRTFAVIGLYRGVGATLFAINFACYLEKYHKAKVAVVELNDEGTEKVPSYEKKHYKSYFLSIYNAFLV